MTIFPPTLLSSVALPSAANAYGVLSLGSQSNSDGADIVYGLNSTFPQYSLSIDEHLPTYGKWERLGWRLRNQAVPPGIQSALGGGTNKKGGSLMQMATDLQTAGKQPLVASFSRHGTAMATLLTTYSATLNSWADDVIAMTGVSWWKVGVISGGENDANGLQSAATYQTTLTNYAATWRAKFPSLFIILTRLNINYNDGGGGAGRDNWRTASAAFVAADGGRSVMIDSDAFGFATPHFTHVGYNSLGSAQAVQALIASP